MAEAADTYSDLDLSDSDDGAGSDSADEAFRAASDFVRAASSRFDTETLLRIYAHYKQATEGPCDAPRPGWYRTQAKMKWDAWKSLGDTPPETAKERYVAIVSQLQPDWRSVRPADSKSWVAVSSLSGEPTDDDPSERTIYDLCRTGDAEGVRAALSESPSALDRPDADGLAPLHWAADRGRSEVVRALVRAGCDVSLTDATGQTALHYASSCGHWDCAALLTEAGIDRSVRDEDGLTAADVACDDRMRDLVS